MDFPILVDSLNRIGVHAVPLMWAIDEHGAVQKTRPQEEWITGEFLTADFPEPTTAPRTETPSAGTVAFLAGKWTDAIAGYREKIKANPDNADAWFRLGSSLRARHDSDNRQDGDFQGAIAAWTKALQLNPPNYIFNRRLQQYGPRLIKPYPFYTWIEEAKADIVARGEEPPRLRVALEGSEIALPDRQGVQAQEANALAEPDPNGLLPMDIKGLVKIESVVAPAPATAGQNARIYLRFQPDQMQKVTWDNEAGELRVWVKTPAGLVLAQQYLESDIPRVSSSNELRSLELEIGIPESLRGETFLEGYAMYYVCEGDEACVFMRQDFKVSLQVTEPTTRRRR